MFRSLPLCIYLLTSLIYQIVHFFWWLKKDQNNKYTTRRELMGEKRKNVNHLWFGGNNSLEGGKMLLLSVTWEASEIFRCEMPFNQCSKLLLMAYCFDLFKHRRNVNSDSKFVPWLLPRSASSTFRAFIKLNLQLLYQLLDTPLSRLIFVVVVVNIKYVTDTEVSVSVSGNFVLR